MISDAISKINWRGRFFRYAPLIFVAAIILFASTTQASMSETSRFIRPLLEFLFPNSPDRTLITYHQYIRKFAHFAEYAGLGFFASRAFWNSGKEALGKYWHLIAFIVVIIIASIDELNQSFNPTRTGSIYDVLLDLFGGSVMITLLLVYKRLRND